MTNKDFLVYSRIDSPVRIILVSRDLERGWHNELDNYDLWSERRGADNGWSLRASASRLYIDLSCPLMSEELMYWE